jgi:hypothetical protein
MTMHEQLRAAMLAAQSTPITPEWVDSVADVETDSAVQVIDTVSPTHDSSSAAPCSTQLTSSEPAYNYLDDDVTADVDLTPVPGNIDDAPANVLTPAPVRETVKVKNLDEKAVLVQVKRRMYSPYKLDTEETRAYGAGNVNKHLFEGRNNRVKEAISKYTEVYAYSKDNTVPWTTGVELLNIGNYMDFTTGLRDLIHSADAAVDDLYRNWDAEVAADLKRLADIAYAKGKPNLANPADYPDADEMRAKFSVEIRYMPVPTADGFDPRLGISDEDKATVQKQLDDACANASSHVLNEMIEPMRRAVGKLTVKIGEDGSVFRDSMIDNMVDVASRMAKVNVSDDPVIAERIKDLQSLVGTYANNKDMLRNVPSVREKAATQIDDLMSKMQGLV